MILESGLLFLGHPVYAIQYGDVVLLLKLTESITTRVMSDVCQCDAMNKATMDDSITTHIFALKVQIT